MNEATSATTSSDSDKQAIKQAIDTIVNNFSKHATLHGHGKSMFYLLSSLRD